MSALWTALMEGETKESLATMVCELREREKDGTASLRSGGPSATPSDARTPIIVLPNGLKLHIGGDFKVVYKEEFLGLAGPIKGRIPEERRAAQLIREAWNKLPDLPSLGGEAEGVDAVPPSPSSGEHNPLSKRIEELEKALRECGADYVSPPCTVSEGAAYVAQEFQRRMAIARSALKDTP